MDKCHCDCVTGLLKLVLTYQSTLDICTYIYTYSSTGQAKLASLSPSRVPVFELTVPIFEFQRDGIGFGISYLLKWRLCCT